LAARLADLFMREIVANSTHGIDLHTGTSHRNNLPQLRANLDDPATEQLARAFGVPVLLNSVLRDGSLRGAAVEKGIPMLLYEAGEALRFDELSIRAGVRGVVNVMRSLGMAPASRRKHSTPLPEPFVARSSGWVRASGSGILRPMAPLGAQVTKGALLGVVSDPFGEKEEQVLSPYSGIVIGRTNLPLVNEGDALFHIARFKEISEVAASVEDFHELYLPGLEDLLHPEGPIT
jgi:hypothetical protein